MTPINLENNRIKKHKAVIDQLGSALYNMIDKLYESNY